jgi:excisionase family DNA binding protein
MTGGTAKKPYLTVREVAAELGCGTRNVYKNIEAGELPALKRSGRRMIVPFRALKAYQRRLNGEPSLAIKAREVSRDQSKPTPAQKEARRAFEAELRELQRHGLNLDPASAAEQGRKAARWLAEQQNE